MYVWGCEVSKRERTKWVKEQLTMKYVVKLRSYCIELKEFKNGYAVVVVVVSPQKGFLRQKIRARSYFHSNLFKHNITWPYNFRLLNF